MSAGAAVERVREALTEHGCAPRGGNLKLRARCPVHGSHGPTLAVSQGRAGAVLNCFAACETPDILAAIGLSWPDLYDEPPQAGYTPKVTLRQPTPAEHAAQVIVRAIGIQLLAEDVAQRVPLGPPRSVDERVAHAEAMCEQEAGQHYWRTLARWAALACDRTYVQAAYRDCQAYRDRVGPRPSHEQYMVLLARAEDLERAR